MELRHLRYFIAVAEELHFGRAAQALGISQPPLSQQIQALEQELGARLFERTNRRVELSEAGRLFLDEARLVLAQVDKAADVARRAQLGEVGELKIGFTASAPFISSIPKAIFNFRQAYPAVHLSLQEMISQDVVERLEHGRLHVGIMRPLPLPDTLLAIEILRDPLVAFLRADHPLVVRGEQGVYMAELALEPFVFFPRTYGSGLYAQVMGLARAAGYNPLVTQEAGEPMTIIGLVAAGLGVTILPASYQRVRIEGVAFRPLLDPGATSPIWLVQRKDEQSPMARAFAALATVRPNTL
ncbi:LysR family transcriptional regulator [Pseudomonas syringae]|nr:LysR family transcriptional regulator [Pseudomonas syringae]MBD8575682.1 LysR family transcriptional regulator [Pseudomonas syringae]MBD8788539.1 LysR family transcriptional regulator [Pseudomonas syringae]MBD8801597.1 LysR family transcriptional regulator [Pseudomonas syringae]MBD8811458.1 LysR family transcriptional regulator [Pseudomonas syringae]